jgi:hypothetical protein
MTTRLWKREWRWRANAPIAFIEYRTRDQFG